jgi:uncharacterized RDD family membrane protein YckC
MSGPNGQLDTRVEIVTPENIAFEYRVAGPFRRLLAYVIDVILRAVVVFVAGVVLLFVGALSGGALAGVATGFWLVLFFVLDWFYGGAFEALWNGQTPGKRLLQLRVVTTDGQPITAWQAVLRNVLRAADAMPSSPMGLVPTFQLGLLAMTFNRRFQRFGDLICGTMVVIEEPHRLYGVLRVGEPGALALAAAIPANYIVPRGMARALSAYVHRRQALGWARRAEIARFLGEPLRVRFGLPQGTSYDLLLCALYHRAFIAERPEQRAASPFGALPAALGGAAGTALPGAAAVGSGPPAATRSP